jgi:hypothetical protein
VGAPGSAPTIEYLGGSPSSIPADEWFTVRWANDFTCPAGWGDLTGFRVVLSGASFDDSQGGGSENTFPADASSAYVQVTGEPGGEVTAQYFAVCSEGESGASPGASMSIEAQPDEPTPTPSTPGNQNGSTGGQDDEQ